MDDRNRVIDLYNNSIVIYNNLKVIRENVDYLLECLDYNFTINGNPVANDAINSVRSDLIDLRSSMYNELLEHLRQYF